MKGVLAGDNMNNRQLFLHIISKYVFVMGAQNMHFHQVITTSFRWTATTLKNGLKKTYCQIQSS